MDRIVVAALWTLVAGALAGCTTPVDEVEVWGDDQDHTCAISVDKVLYFEGERWDPAHVVNVTSAQWRENATVLAAQLDQRHAGDPSGAFNLMTDCRDIAPEVAWLLSLYADDPDAEASYTPAGGTAHYFFDVALDDRTYRISIPGANWPAPRSNDA